MQTNQNSKRFMNNTNQKFPQWSYVMGLYIPKHLYPPFCQSQVNCPQVAQDHARPAPSVENPVERDVVETPNIPDYLMDIYKLMSANHPAVSMNHSTFSAVVHFDQAMICVMPDRISGFVSAKARVMYKKTDDDFIKWIGTLDSPCFWVSVLNREDAVRAEKEIDMLLSLHFTQDKPEP